MIEEALHGVELRHLSALVAVARERSFRGAADSLGYVQSAVSQQVADLERLVGVRLVERSRGRHQVCLTEPGELLVSHAREILARLGAAHADLIARAQVGQEATLRVGVYQSIATGFLPAVIRRLGLAAPQLRIVPVEATHDAALFELVERGSADLAFADLPLKGPFESCTILADPCVLLVAADSEWAQPAAARPTLGDLAALPLIAPERCRFTSALAAWSAVQGHDLNFTLRVAHDATVRALVAAGAGSAIVSRLAADARDERITMIDLGEVVPSRKLALFWQRERGQTSALELFRSAALATAEELSPPRGDCVEPPVESPVSLAAA